MAVRCAVEDDDGRLLVRLSGHLDQRGAADVRIRLLKCLAEQPDAVLVDLSALTVDQPLRLTVFAAIAWQAARWPGIPVLLCAPRPETAASLNAAAYRRLPVLPSVAAGRDEARTSRRSLPTVRDDLLPVAGAARHARNLATEACLRWELPHLVGPASLVVSELVSNVVEHAHTMMALRLSLWDRYLHIAVRDGSVIEPGLPDRPTPAQLRGRGLYLVEGTANSWGCLPTEGGKVVWASLLVDAPAGT
jgi:anti-anti-sigma regulatory factor